MPNARSNQESGRYSTGLRSAVRHSVDISVLMIGRGSQIVANILSLRIATTLMLPQQLASLSQLASLTGLFSTTLMAPVSQYVERGFLEWAESGLLVKYLLRFVQYVVVASILVICLAWFVQSQFHAVNGISSTWVIILIGLFFAANSLNTLSASGLNLLGRRIAFVFFSNLSQWVGLGLAVGLLLVFSQPELWVLGQNLGIAISCISIFVLLKHIRTYPVSADKSQNTILFKPWLIFSFAWPQLITLILWWIQSQSYRFVLDRVSSLENVGLFSVGYGLCAMPMNTFENLFNQFYGPYYYNALKRQDTDGRANAWNDLASAYIPAIILVGAFTIGGGTLLPKVFVGKKFQAVGTFLIWPAVIETVRAIGSMLHHMGIAKVDMKIMILPLATGAVIAPLSVYFLAGTSPLHGTGIALLLATLGAFIVAIPTSYRALPVKWPIRRILYAVLLGLPMIIGFKIVIEIFPQITTWNAIIILSVGGFYLLMAEYIFAKEWLIKIGVLGKIDSQKGVRDGE